MFLRNIALCSIVLLLYLCCCYRVFHNSNNESKDNTSTSSKTYDAKQTINIESGSIEVEKIGLHQKLYDIDDMRNNVDQNVAILHEPNDGIFIIAAHSGMGPLAYFKNLHKLENNDIITVKYKNKQYQYQLYNQYELDKTGKIRFQKDTFDKLILTTCSIFNDTKQLVMEAKKIN